MSNDHVDAHLRAILDNIANTHRYARAELREGMAALNRVNRQTMSEPTEPMKIIIERSPYPNAEPQYRWTAYYEDREDELSKSGMTPDEALGRFLIAVTNRDEPEID
jgi:hypothetical protein